MNYVADSLQAKHTIIYPVKYTIWETEKSNENHRNMFER